MRVEQSAAKEISSALREFGVEQSGEDELELYVVDDATAVFGPDEQGNRIFQGLSFIMARRDFHVLSNLELVVAEPVDGEEDAVFVIEDESLIELTNRYLLWRAELLRTLKF